MRLSDVLSKSLTSDFIQVEGFLGNRNLGCGKQRKIMVGRICLNYFCKQCKDVLTFSSDDKLYCIGINESLVSIDCVLRCAHCDTEVPVWFLVECKNGISVPFPEVRILKRSERLSEHVMGKNIQYGEFSELIEKAECAYRAGLGAGAIIYLRKILESITYEVAKLADIDINKKNGNKKPFKQILEKVDKECNIIPKEFSNNSYKLFGTLSNIIHGDSDEQEGLKKYDALHRLVIGVLDNVKNSKELTSAIDSLGWNEGYTDSVSNI
jgi:hypothetical protein